MSIRIKPWVATSLLGAAMVVAGSVAPAQEQVLYRFDLPAQPLAEALRAIARQTGANVLFESKDLRGIRSRELKGQLTPSEAIQRVLEGTRLEAQQTTPTTVIVQPTPVDSSARAASAESREVIRLAQSDTPSASQVDSQQSSASNGEGGGDDENRAQPRTMVELEEIVVTGSHIRGTTVDGPSPVIVFDREAIERTGVATIQQFFDKLPQNFSGGSNASNASLNGLGRDMTNNTGRGSSLNLRGLGTGTTLTLINGRRITASNQFQFVDVSLIPMSAVERVEVLTDGASAIYGSDAIGGVVNIVLRKDFEGYETQLRYGSVTAGDMQEYQAAQTAGWSWADGHALLSYEYLSQGNLSATDKQFSRNSPFQPFDLYPESDRHSVYLSGEQRLADHLSIEAGGIYARRDHGAVVTTTAGVQESTPSTEQYDLHLGAKLEIGRWQARLNASYGENKAELEFNRLSPAGVRTTTHPSTFSDSAYVDLAADGPLLTLPAGAVRAAFGASYRDDSYEDNNGLASQVIVSDSRSVTSAYAEVIFPLAGPDQNIPAVHRLELSAAVRHDRYSDFGSSTNPKFGIAYETVPGALLRATYGTSFRAPLFQDLSTVSTSTLVYYLPNTASANGRTLTMVAIGGNSGLQAEEAKTWTAGISLKPELLRNFSLELNYYSIEHTDRIDSGFPANVTTIWAQPGPYESVITRNPPVELINELRALGQAGTQFTVFRTGPFAVPAGLNENNVQAVLDNRLRNNAETAQDGVDANASYQGAIGNSRLRLSLAGQYILSSTRRVTSASAPADVLNQVYLPIDLKLRAGMELYRGDWNAAMFYNYVDSYEDLGNPADRTVDAWNTVDLNVQYVVPETAGTMASGTALVLGVQNLFDKDPPFVLTPRGGPFDPANANALGRFVSLAVTKKW